jgi:hypothetical protein
MTTCANCSESATYIYEISEAHTILYCGLHLPKFLNDRKNAGTLKLTAEAVQEKSDAFEALAPKSSKKSSKAIVEEVPVVEEPVVEEEPTTPEE